MRRALASLLLLATSLPLVVTGFVLVRFQLERDRIIREVCVQRDRPIEKNCCKGSCQLEKQLKEQEGQEPGSSVPPRIELRVEPAVLCGPMRATLCLAASVRLFGGDPASPTRAGHPALADHVPWA